MLMSSRSLSLLLALGFALLAWLNVTPTAEALGGKQPALNNRVPGDRAQESSFFALISIGD